MKLQTSLKQAIGSREIEGCPEWKYYISKGLKPAKTIVKLTEDQLTQWLRRISGHTEGLFKKEPRFVTRDLMIQCKPAEFGRMELILFHPEGHIESFFLTKLDLLNRRGKAAA